MGSREQGAPCAAARGSAPVPAPEAAQAAATLVSAGEEQGELVTSLYFCQSAGTIKDAHKTCTCFYATQELPGAEKSSNSPLIKL